MSVDPHSNPFRPGTGSSPPVLAGRQDEREALSRLLKGLTDGTLGQTIHLLQAPRGMGKTVLLLDLVAHAPADVAVIHADAPSLPNLAEAARIIAPPLTWWRSVLQGLSGVSMVGIRVERPTRSVDSDLRTFEKAFERRRERPFLLVIDEAHTLAPELARTLLNRFQSLSGRQPAALLLAGTPALKPFLLSRAVGASFVERAPMIVPGLFSQAQCREALDVPHWRGWRTEETVLEEAARDSVGYPYFVQLWGKALWDAGCGRQALDDGVLEEARQQVDAIRAEFYASRFDEFERDAVEAGIGRDAMLKAGQVVAAAVRSPEDVLTTGDLDRLLQDAGLDPTELLVGKRIMVENGFVTRTAGDWAVGIPSLATYICEHPRV